MVAGRKNLDVVTYTADMGQGDIPDDLEEEKAKVLELHKVIIDDLSEEFVSEYVYPMFRCNLLFMKVNICLELRSLDHSVAKTIGKNCESENTNIISHGATGKGNDQIRFEIGAHSFEL